MPERKTGSLKSRRSTAGTFADSSRTMKRANAKTNATKQPVMSGESNQSFRSPSSSAYCSEHSPTLRNAIPAQSMFFRCSAAAFMFAARMSSGSWTKRVTMKVARTPTGTLM